MSRKSKKAQERRRAAALEAPTVVEEPAMVEEPVIVEDIIIPEAPVMPEAPTLEEPAMVEEPAIPEEAPAPKASRALPIKFTLPQSGNAHPSLLKVARLGGTLLVLLLLSVGLLSWMHHATAGVIAANEAQAALELEALVPGLDAFELLTDPTGAPIEAIWEARAATETVGWRVRVALKGIEDAALMVGIRADGVVSGLRLVPVAGDVVLEGVADQPEWLKLFVGLTGTAGLSFTDEAAADSAISPEAVTVAVQAALDYVNARMGGAQ